MNQSLLKIQIGPVQDFIAQARSTRDLWSGSYLLSWLMASGAKALVQAAGGVTSVVISPVLAGQPIYDFHVDPKKAVSDHHNDAILTPNFTNILVAKLPADRAAAAAAVEAMVKAIRHERDAIAVKCWEKLAQAGLVDASAKDRFFAQVKVFPTITWQLTAAPPVGQRKTWLESVPLADGLRGKLLAAKDDFPAQITRNSWELDAVRSLREFKGWNSGLGGHEKDSLTGREEGVVGGKEWWRARVKKLHERAKAAAADGSPLQDFLWPILFRERQEDDWFGAIQLIKRVWHWAYLAESPWELRSTQKREPLGKDFPFPSTVHIAIHDPAKNVREYLTGQLEAALEDEIDERQVHTPYFAVLALDGDQMGAWLGGENNDKGPTEEFRSGLSERLSNFALHCVRPIVEACDGRLILAGGEDVLALLPADTAADCAGFLRAAYRGGAGFLVPLFELAKKLRQHHLHNGYEEPPDRDAKKPEMSAFLVAAARETLFKAGTTDGSLVFNPSLAPSDSSEFAAALTLKLPGGVDRSPGVEIPDVSAGLAIAHFKEPLQDVVQAALAAEKRAKNELGRAALAITLVKHSGETVKWGCQWQSGGLELLDLIQRGRGTGVFSGRFPHRLVEVLSPYLLTRDSGETVRLEEATGFGEKVDEIIAREFTLVLDRQSDSKRLAAFVKEHDPLKNLTDFLAKLPRDDAQAKLRAVIGLCQIAAFIEPAVYAPGFVESKSNA